MIISSRTPEGDPNCCPVCGHRPKVEPSIDTRDAPCPVCGHLLWFNSKPAISPNLENLARTVVRIAGERLGRAPLSVWAAVFRVEEIDQMEDLMERASDAESWEELLAGVE